MEASSGVFRADCWAVLCKVRRWPVDFGRIAMVIVMLLNFADELQRRVGFGK
jgi:hypothetical protein